jgi:hypothetical protein
MPRRRQPPSFYRHFGPDADARLDPLVRKSLARQWPPTDKRQWFWDDRITGFGIMVTALGKESFVYQYRFGGRSYRLTFRGHDVAAAREWAAQQALKLAAGQDPGGHHLPVPGNARSLRQVVRDYLTIRGSDFKSRVAFERTLENHVLPVLGSRPYETITRQDLAALRDNIAARAGRHAAHKALQNLSAVWTNYYRDHASDTFTWPQVLSPLKHSNKNGGPGRTLSDLEIRQIWHATFKLRPNRGAFYRFLFLTGMRRGLGADGGASRIIRANVAPDWSWVFYPGAGLGSTKPPHTVPLSGAAQELLREHFPEDAAWAFAPLGPYERLKRDLDKQLAQVAPWRNHDIRHTVRTLLSRVSTPDTAERALGHSLGGERKRYDHHDYTPEVRTAMEALARLVFDIVK